MDRLNVRRAPILPEPHGFANPGVAYLRTVLFVLTNVHGRVGFRRADSGVLPYLRGLLVAKSQRAKPARRPKRRRIPLTITLNPSNYEFVESCAALKAFRSVDELFDAALMIYQQHTRALLAYTEMQSDKGMTRDEILRSVKCEILFTRTAAVARLPRRPP